MRSGIEQLALRARQMLSALSLSFTNTIIAQDEREVATVATTVRDATIYPLMYIRM